MPKIATNNRFYFVLYGMCCLLYILFFGPYGFEDTDTGYIFGTSWNIYNGILPHRDFIYTRPAIPAFVHTLFLYVSETYGYLLDRAFFYVQIFVYSLLTLKIINHKINLGTSLNTYLLALMGAIFSIHNYPPMGWNTTDGVFFWILGVYFIFNKEKKWFWFFGSLFLVLGTLSKQSFFFMPLFLVGFLIYFKERERIKFVFLFTLFWVGCYLVLKHTSNSLLPMWEQIFNRTGGSALIEASIKPYYLALKNNLLWVMISFLIIFISKKWLPKELTFLLIITAIALYFAKWYVSQPSFKVVPNITQIMLLFSGVVFSIKFLKNKNYGILLFLLLLSWSASISNGYRTPILYATPLLLGIYLFLFKESDSFKNKYVPYASIIALLVAFTIGYQTPYMDSNRRELNKDMGAVFKPLQFIKSDVATFEKYQELKNLASQYPNFTVLPSMCLAHYLTKTVNPIGTDWVLDVEINDKSALLLDQLYQKKVTLFIEKEVTQVYAKENYSILFAFQNKWQLIEENEYFNIYTPLNKDN
ncbi:MAG: hypothetical protein R2781_10010 [Flavobacteriaceae bacterium]